MYIWTVVTPVGLGETGPPQARKSHRAGADLGGGTLGTAAPPLNPRVKIIAKYNKRTVLITPKKLSPIHDSWQ